MSSMYDMKRIAEIDLILIPGDTEGDHIFLIHGYGANEFDLASFTKYISPENKPLPNYYFPGGPISIDLGMGYTGKAWFPIDIEMLPNVEPEVYANLYPPEFERSRRMLSKVLTELHLEPSKIILGGFSQGAMLATDIALNSKDTVKSLLIYSGSLVNQKKWEKLIPRHKNLPFFQSHGAQDSILKLKSGKELNKMLLEGGMQGEFFPFAGGHEIPIEVLHKTLEFLSKL